MVLSRLLGRSRTRLPALLPAVRPAASKAGPTPNISEPTLDLGPHDPDGCGFEVRHEVAPREIDHLLAANREWTETNKEWFDRHGASEHRPRYLWIGCSDARVPANQIIGEPAGTVFVHRNIANLVVSSDMNLLSVLQYAVNVLRVPHIIVCGHYDCGGIKAAMGRTHHDSRDVGSPLQDWLHNIRDVCRLHHEELGAITDATAKHRRLVELNVVEQCLNLFKTGVVQRRRLLTSQVTGAYPQPRVHGVVYDPKDGVLKKLDNDFRAERKKLAQHYDLFMP